MTYKYWKSLNLLGRALSQNNRIPTCLFYVNKHVIKHTDHFQKYTLKLNWGGRKLHVHLISFMKGSLKRRWCRLCIEKSQNFAKVHVPVSWASWKLGQKLSSHIKELWKIPSQNSLFGRVLCAVYSMASRNDMGIKGREFFLSFFFPRPSVFFLF